MLGLASPRLSFWGAAVVWTVVVETTEVTVVWTVRVAKTVEGAGSTVVVKVVVGAE